MSKKILFPEDYLKKKIKELKLEEVSIFTMSANKRIIEDFVKNNEDTEFNLYVHDNSYWNLLGLEKEYDNLNINNIKNNHIKALIGKKENGEHFAFFGSSNYTKSGLKYNFELNFAQNTEYDINKNLKFSCSSVIQGLAKELKKQTKEKVLENKISTRPIEFLGAKKVWKKNKK